MFGIIAGLLAFAILASIGKKSESKSIAEAKMREDNYRRTRNEFIREYCMSQEEYDKFTEAVKGDFENAKAEIKSDIEYIFGRGAMASGPNTYLFNKPFSSYVAMILLAKRHRLLSPLSALGIASGSYKNQVNASMRLAKVINDYVKKPEAEFTMIPRQIPRSYPEPHTDYIWSPLGIGFEPAALNIFSKYPESHMSSWEKDIKPYVDPYARPLPVPPRDPGKNV